MYDKGKCFWKAQLVVFKRDGSGKAQRIGRSYQSYQSLTPNFDWDEVRPKGGRERN
jgi:hypothetical protein